MKKEEFKKKLEKIGYDEDYVDETLSYVDNEKDIESLYEKVKYLIELGVVRSNINIIIQENPLILTVTLESIKSSVDFLKSIKLKNVVKTIQVNSELLSVSDSIMSENYKLLKILLPENDVLDILDIDAEILSFNTDYLEKRLEFFVKNGLKDNIKDIILNHFEAFEDTEEEIDLEDLKKYKKKV